MCLTLIPVRTSQWLIILFPCLLRVISLFVWLVVIVYDRKFSVGIIFFSHINQPTVLLHEPATMRTSQPNRLLNFKRLLPPSRKKTRGPSSKLELYFFFLEGGSRQENSWNCFPLSCCEHFTSYKHFQSPLFTSIKKSMPLHILSVMLLLPIAYFSNLLCKVWFI